MEIEKGYLVDPYRVFYLQEQGYRDYSAHYHDFHKCIVVLKGHLDYNIEGRNYAIEGPSVVLVKEHQVHHVKVYGDQPYERLVIYLRSDFLHQQSTRKTNLAGCFSVDQPVIPLHDRSSDPNDSLMLYVHELARHISQPHYGEDVMLYALALGLLVQLNNLCMEEVETVIDPAITYDERVEKALGYIQDNLENPIPIQTLAEVTYISKYHLMRLFKQETGYSIHQYILEKRLIQATRYIREGLSYSEGALKAGFKDYSIFLRAFKNRYHLSPRAYFEEKQG